MYIIRELLQNNIDLECLPSHRCLNTIDNLQHRAYDTSNRNSEPEIIRYHGVSEIYGLLTDV